MQERKKSFVNGFVPDSAIVDNFKDQLQPFRGPRPKGLDRMSGLGIKIFSFDIDFVYGQRNRIEGTRVSGLKA